jgi:hypothetical protein
MAVAVRALPSSQSHRCLLAGGCVQGTAAKQFGKDSEGLLRYVGRILFAADNARRFVPTRTGLIRQHPP